MSPQTTHLCRNIGQQTPLSRTSLQYLLADAFLCGITPVSKNIQEKHENSVLLCLKRKVLVRSPKTPAGFHAKA